ncbi:hypothetical protein LZ906_010855 [Paraclostridium ghonii]|uniref:hypothetical protein n=1 Tax=Paraclostridium ghonii TaxID=29358 RepID=UPI00202CE839|nr:hypothetical protein [Paeniclostridium ghonii]MCM0166506.1 hypothetical protein [Paeniclostridium ghonii]
MTSNMFSTNEIIIIVMAMIEDIKNEEIYGIESEELNIPKDISEKIYKLEDKICEEFFDLIYEIANKLYTLKNGELNELNIIHKEILDFSNIKLKMYMI